MSALTSSRLLTSWALLTSLLHFTTSCPSPGATEGLREVVEGRCFEYKTNRPSAVCNQSQPINCKEATTNFLAAFAGQPPCDITLSRYDAYLASTRHAIPVDKSLFWSGVYQFVHRYSQGGSRMTTLEDTLTGHMVDGLRFCSSPQEPGGIGGPQTQNCPTFSDTANCTLNAEFSFWAAASKNFATRARGVITIMLNASREEAFRSNSSFLAEWEMPNLVSGEVTHTNIWIVQFPGTTIRSTCASASIKKLESVLSAKNISSTCTENPRDVFWLLCWDRPDHPQCHTLLTSGTSTTSGMEKIFVLMVASLLFLNTFE
ncbi:hypothetical protein ACOMHN_047698 [Nucella lapillus]